MGARGMAIPQEQRTIPLSVSSNIITAVKTGEPILVNDVRQHSPYLFSSPSIRSELATPIKIGENLIGVIDAGSEQSNAFDETDRRLLGVLASHVGVAIRELQRKEELEFLLTLLRHDIKNRLTVTQGYLDLLEESALSEKDEKLRRKAFNASREMEDMLRKIGKLKAVEERAIQQVVSLHLLLSRVIEEYEDTARSKDIEIVYHDAPYEVQGGPLLEDLFSNLIDIAIEHSNGSKVEISAKVTENNVRVTVEDDGRGIPEKMRGELFKRGKKGSGSSGLGIGLYLVKQIADKYQGKITVKESELGGARFDVYLKRS